MAHSRSFLANQKARNAIVGAENLLRFIMQRCYPSQEMTILTYYFLLIFKIIALKTLSIQ